MVNKRVVNNERAVIIAGKLGVAVGDYPYEDVVAALSSALVCHLVIDPELITCVNPALRRLLGADVAAH